MANIYTKTGDKGQTGLYGGSRVEKDSPKVECYGTLDEAISMLGLAYTETDRAEIKEYINHIQVRMFQAGAEVASDERGMEMLKDKISEADIDSSSRKQQVAYARQMLMYVLRNHFNIQLQIIGDNLGDRDHATIAHGVDKIASMIKSACKPS